MKPEQFLEIVNKDSEVDYGLCPSPISAEKGLKILIDHFLGENWYVVSSVSNEQAYTEAIYQILKKNQKRKSIFKRLFFR